LSRTDIDPPTDPQVGAVGDAATEDSPKSTDGRHARSERSREAMVDALLELLREGGGRPSSAQIAERAGVTQRTLFNQFGDMDSLISAVAVRQTQRFVKLIPDAGTGSLDERVANYCDGLARLLEDTMHVRWAVVTNPNPSWDGDSIVRMAAEYMRQLMTRSFQPEFDQLTAPVATEVLDALEVATDPVTWRLRRVQQGKSSDEARAVVARTMLAVLRDATAAPAARRTA
jgi:AcrR family transcriptional regulator